MAQGAPRAWAVGALSFLAVALGAPPVASAEDADATAVAKLQAIIDGADPLFAEYVVGPIAAALFQDVVFWDDGQSAVNGVAFGPDGALVSVGEDGRLVRWTLPSRGGAPKNGADETGGVKLAPATDGEPAVFDLSEGPLRQVVARPRTERGASEVAVGLASGAVVLVDARSGTILHRFDLQDAPTAIDFDPTGSVLLVGTAEGRVFSFPASGGPGRRLFQDPKLSIQALAVGGSTLAPELAFATSDDALYVGSITPGGGFRRLAGHRRGVSALAFGPDGTLASGGEDGRVLLHRPGATEPERLLAFGEEQVVDLAFPQPDRLVVGRPASVQLLERSVPLRGRSALDDGVGNGSWSEVRVLKAMVLDLAVDPTGSTVLVARTQGQVRWLDLETGDRLAILSAHATEVEIPFIVLWLVTGAVFFTLRFRFVNVRAFLHAIEVTRGKYDGESAEGDVSHFQALAMALSATVGLGNIAGVAIAVGAGGPGAVFWMVVAGFLGMSSKFVECTLGQMYREVDVNGHVTGGPMHYLRRGLSELGAGALGRALSVVFAVLCIFGSLGGGNMFQANQSYAQVASVIPVFQGEIGSLVYGLLLSGLVGIVIIGGIHRIGQVASLIVPFMVGVYIIAAGFILVANAPAIPGAFVEIVRSAFTPGAAYGGALGVMITGFRRAAFSNEAGIGSASIAHSAAATGEPVREGIVALLEPFIDTIVVCTTTALVLVVTGAYETEADGVVMTSKAFATVLPWFPVVLTCAVFLFAFSTMISWSYYGERCWGFLFGERSSIVYKVVFVMAVVLGSVIQLRSVLDFSDLMILGMAFPNMLGAALLSGKVRARLQDYLARLKSGLMEPVR